MKKEKSLKKVKIDELKEANELCHSLSTLLLSRLKSLPLEYKFKIGTGALSVFIANFCYSIIDKNHPEECLKLLEDIKNLSTIFITDRYSDQIKDKH